MNKVMITGADGFIGHNITKKLLEEGFEVYAVVLPDRNIYASNTTPSLHVICLDLKDILYHLDDFPSDIDTLYHFAWVGVHPELRDDFSIQSQNIQISLDCVKFAGKMGIKRIIFPGSTNEYLYYGKPIGKNAVPSPANSYGAVKVALRYMLNDLCRKNGIDFIYTILAGIYAADRKDNNVIYYVINELLHHRTPKLTRLEQLWDYVYIDDVVDALIAIGKKGKSDAVYAVGHGDNWPLSNYIEIIHQLIAPEIPLELGAIPYANEKMPCSCIDLSDLIQDTGFLPRVDFSNGISRVISKLKYDLYKSI